MKAQLLAAAVLGIFGQDPVVRVIVVTPDGNAIVGLPSVKSLSFETTVGKLEFPFHKLARIEFLTDEAVATGTDGSKIRGKVNLEKIVVKSLLGDLSFLRKDVSAIGVMLGDSPPIPAPTAKERILVVHIETKDLQNLMGTVDLDSISFESTLGTFAINPAQMATLQHLKDNWKLVLKDGSILMGAVKLSDFKITTGLGNVTIKQDRIYQLSVREVKDPRDVPRPAPLPVRPPLLQPLSRKEVMSDVADLVLDHDGNLCGINATDGRLQRWRLPGMEEDASGSFQGSMTAIAIEPEGNWIFGVGKKNVFVFEKKSLKLSKAFAIEHNLLDVHALDGDKLIVTGYDGTFLVSVEKTAVVQKIDKGDRAFTVLVKRDRLYVKGTFLQVVRPSASEVVIDWGYAENEEPPMDISPDHRWGVTSQGNVYRIGRTVLAQRIQYAELRSSSDSSRTRAAVFSNNSEEIYKFTDDGYLRVYGTQDVKERSSHFLGILVTKVVVEPSGRGLVVAGYALVNQANPERPGQRLGSESKVNLFRFEIPK